MIVPISVIDGDEDDDAEDDEDDDDEYDSCVASL